MLLSAVSDILQMDVSHGGHLHVLVNIRNLLCPGHEWSDVSVADSASVSHTADRTLSGQTTRKTKMTYVPRLSPARSLCTAKSALTHLAGREHGC